MIYCEIAKLPSFSPIQTLANILGVTYQAIFQYENWVREPSLEIFKNFPITLE